MGGVNFEDKMDELIQKLRSWDGRIIQIDIEKEKQQRQLDMAIQEQQDNIHHPSHYSGRIEVIDYIRDKLSVKELAGYYKGNILKYVSRFGKKETRNPTEDLEKAQVYLQWYIDLINACTAGYVSDDKAKPGEESDD